MASLEHSVKHRHASRQFALEVRGIFEKLGISNRVELVLYALTNSKRAPMSVPGEQFSTAMDRAERD